MHTVSLEHVQLTNQLRAYKREVYGAVAVAFDRLRTEGGVDLEEAAERLSLYAAAQVVVREREINQERLVEYLVNGMSLDVSGLPSPLGPASEGDRIFGTLSAQIDQVVQTALTAYADQPYAASLAIWLEGERRHNRFKAWAMTHPTCTLS